MGMVLLTTLCLLTNSSLLSSIMQNPPADLASLLEPKAVLEQMNVKTDEQTLIKLLAVDEKLKIPKAALEKAVRDLGSEDSAIRAKAERLLKKAGDAAIPVLNAAQKNADPEVRVKVLKLLHALKRKRVAKAVDGEAYVKRLMAIRALQEMKSKKGLPALQSIADGGNVTLADAARTAIAVINGRKPKRPSGAETLKQVMTRLPGKVGFVGAWDMEKASEQRTMSQFLANAKKTLKADPKLVQMTTDLMKELPKVNTNLAKTIATIGNIRIDSVTLFSTLDLGTGKDCENGIFALYFKGLHDPSMMANALNGNNRMTTRRYKKNTFLYGHEIAFCSIDETTFVIVRSASRDCSQILCPILDAWHNQPNKMLKPEYKKVFDAVVSGKARLALGGRFGAAQKLPIHHEFDSTIKRHKKRGKQSPPRKALVNIFESMLRGVDAKFWWGTLGAKNTVTLEAVSASPADAKTFADGLKTMDKNWRALITQNLQESKGTEDDKQLALLAKHLELASPVFTASSEKDVTRCNFHLQDVVSMWTSLLIAFNKSKHTTRVKRP